LSISILHLDIETAPNAAYVWGLWKENIPLARIINSGYVLSWAAKWNKEGEIFFDSLKPTNGSTQNKSPLLMLGRVHKLLDQADVVVHYNGQSFDIPTLNKEFVTHGFTPPSTYKQVDLLKVVREQFRFPSNKLDYVLSALKLGQKVRHPGFEMWVKCMAGDVKSWEQMERYNKHDVRVLERLYHRLLPWIKGHPNIGAYEGVAVCPHCGGHRIQHRGYTVTRNLMYRRFQCQSCGTWFRNNKTVTQKGIERYIGV
jgi:hypothetical protein